MPAPRKILQSSIIRASRLRQIGLFGFNIFSHALPGDQRPHGILQSRNAGAFRQEKNDVVPVAAWALVDARLGEKHFHKIEAVSSPYGAALLVVVNDRQAQPVRGV